MQTLDRVRLASRIVALLTFLAAATSAVGAYIAGVGASGSSEVLTARAVVLAAAITAGALVLGKFVLDEILKRISEGERTSLQQELDAERLRVMAVTNSVFQAAALRLGELSTMSPSGRRSEISAMRQFIVERAVELLRCEAPRASYFKLVPNVSPRQMRHNKSASRARLDETTRTFREGQSLDQGVWQVLDTDGVSFVRDIEVDAPADFDRHRQRAYKTYITVAVTVPGRAFGVLTVNALTPGDLTDIDVASMRVLARLLGAAEELV